MAILDMVRRIFMGGGMPTTETVQREIEGVLSADGKADAHLLYARVSLGLPPAQRRMAVDQASQILVNRGIVRARHNGQDTQPIYATGAYTLSYPTEDTP